MSEPQRIEYRDITPACRDNRGEDKAWEDAVHELWHTYCVLADRNPEATFRLALERGKGDAT